MRRCRIPARTSLGLALLLVACGGQEQKGAVPTGSSPAAFTVTPVAAYGRLKVCGTHICSQSGQPVQLRGMSFFWSNTGWGGERFFNSSAVSNLAATWNATVIRAPLGVEGKGGYLESSTAAAANLARVKALIDAAISAGVYVIVDWHYSSSAVYQSQAQAVFQQLAQQYASVPNIIWEPFNEPTSNSWASLKAYHQAIISTIRAAGSQNLVVVGTPTWSQDVDVASRDRITTDPNVAYMLHFYAGTHTQWLRDKANTAMGNGAAIFVTEYGTCDASGNGNFNPTESKNWTNWMDQNQISSANWSLNDKAETASALVVGASATGPWPDSQLTQSGAWVKPYVVAGYSSSPPPTTYALTVTRSGNGNGTVTSSPAGVSCGSTCSASFSSGTSVTLTAAPASGSTFGGWSGACSGTGACTVSMTQARSVTATFTASTPGAYTLTVTRAGTGSGTVTSSPAGVSCGSACSATFAAGTSVTLTAAAASGTSFAGWSGACSGTGGCTVTLSQAQSVTATFNAITPPPSNGGCHVVYTVSNQWAGGFQAAITIQNTGTAAWTSWSLSWTFGGDQKIGQLWNGSWVQSGAAVTVNNMSYNGSVPAGGSYTGMGFTGTFTSSNAAPTGFAVNGLACN